MSEELKPVRCGCGGEAKIEWANGYDPFAEKRIPKLWYGVICKKCKIQTKAYYTEAEAITAWNRAMGATDMNVGDKERTAKVINRRYNGTALGIVGLADSSYGTCVNCWGDVLDRYTYCPHCGARLEWK